MGRIFKQRGFVCTACHAYHQGLYWDDQTPASCACAEGVWEPGYLRSVNGPAVVDDQIEGGPRLFDTMGHEPVWIESKSQWKAEVAARELVHVDRHDRAYYDRKFRQHDEMLRDTGQKH